MESERFVVTGREEGEGCKKCGPVRAPLRVQSLYLARALSVSSSRVGSSGPGAGMGSVEVGFGP